MNPKLKKVGLIFKRHDPRVPSILTDLIPWLRSRQVEIYLDEALAGPYAGACIPTPPARLPGQVDVFAVFGGDGTLLYAARLAAGSATPILGINLGSLGFLTEVKLERMKPAFEALLSGNYHLEDRMLLKVEVFRNNELVERYMALNDAVINKGALARIIEVEVKVGAQLVSTFRGDGLIISTPTGSTAYSLSAGGPIVFPTLAAFIITPICPHALTNRPVVVPDSGTIDVTLLHGADVMLTVDGQVGMPLAARDALRLQKATPSVRLVLPEGNTFFKILREKLKWS
jgi:NAD+ kinase